MFKDLPEGETHYCDHRKDGLICDQCLGILREETKRQLERLTIMEKLQKRNDERVYSRKNYRIK